MSKLKPEDLVVTSFGTTGEQGAARLPTADPDHPTPMTYCEWCPPFSDACA